MKRGEIEGRVAARKSPNGEVHVIREVDDPESRLGGRAGTPPTPIQHGWHSLDVLRTGPGRDLVASVPQKGDSLFRGIRRDRDVRELLIYCSVFDAGCAATIALSSPPLFLPRVPSLSSTAFPATLAVYSASFPETSGLLRHCSLAWLNVVQVVCRRQGSSRGRTDGIGDTVDIACGDGSMCQEDDMAG